ncbi:MAG: phosphatase PAP2 family protein [Anaerolineae bacterium]
MDAIGSLLVNDYLMPSAIVLLLVWLWLRGRSAEERARDTITAVNAVAAQFVANMILKGINLAYFRPRPFDALPNVNLVFYRPWDSSCPSNPAAFAFAVAVSIYLGDRRLGLLALSMGAAWTVSRVYAGVHYPLDVIAGAALGGSVAYWLSRRSRGWAWLREHLLSLLRKGMVA